MVSLFNQITVQLIYIYLLFKYKIFIPNYYVSGNIVETGIHQFKKTFISFQKNIKITKHC